MYFGPLFVEKRSSSFFPVEKSLHPPLILRKILSPFLSSICRIQSGKYPEALELMEERLNDELENDELGQRPDELADVYQNMARCMSEVCNSSLTSLCIFPRSI